MSSLAFGVRDEDHLGHYGLRPGGRFDQWMAQTPHYVLCDVDGTLLGTSHAPTQPVVDAVTDARHAKMRLGIATGRMRASVNDLITSLAVNGPHIFHNGAEVFGDGIHHMWPLEPLAVDRLIQLAARMPHGYVEVCTTDGYYVTAMDTRAAAHWQMLGSEPDGVIAAQADLGDRPALKATVVLFDQRRDAVAAVTEELTAMGLAVGAAGSPRTPALDYLNVTAPSVNKGAAACQAVTSLGLQTGQLAAVGDEANDLPLFAQAATAIAMGQADEAVVRAAHVVAPPVHEDGAAHALRFLAHLSRGS